MNVANTTTARFSPFAIVTLILATIVSVTVCGVFTIQNLGYPLIAPTILNLNPVWHEQGHLYIAALPTNAHSQEWGRSNAIVLENGVPLPHGNVEHSKIRAEGGGRFSFWGREVYFATLDNSDPTKNGRSYSAVLPCTFSTSWVLSSYLMVGLLVTILHGCFARYRESLSHVGQDRGVLLTSACRRFNAVWQFCSTYQDILICTLIALLTLFVRWNTATLISTGGDATNYWDISARLSLGEGVSSWHHKSARFGILIPVTLSQLLFGLQPINYYLTPFAFWVALTILTYLTGMRIANRSVGFIASMSLLAFGQLDECASQILPSVYESVYLLLTFYLLTWIGPNRAGTFVLVFAVLTFFLGYGSKETDIFFLPGVCLFLWIRAGTLARPIQFGVATLLLIAGETAFYYFYAGISGGRLAVMSRSHLDVMTNIEPSFSSLIGRFFLLPTEWLYAYAAFALACLNIPFSRKSRESLGMAIGVVSFILLLLCAVKKLDPITPAVRFLPRYMDVTAPFVALLVFAALHNVLRGVLFPIALLLRSPTAALASTMLVILGLQGPIRAVERFMPTPFSSVRTYSDLVTKSLTTGQPIAMREEKTHRTLSRLLVGSYRAPLHIARVEVDNTSLYLAVTAPELASPERIATLRAAHQKVTFLQREPLLVDELTLDEIVSKGPQ